MLGLAFLFLILTLAAAVFGFGAIIAAGVAIAKTLFWVFLVLMVISLFISAAGGRRRPVV